MDYNICKFKLKHFPVLDGIYKKILTKVMDTSGDVKISPDDLETGQLSPEQQREFTKAINESIGGDDIITLIKAGIDNVDKKLEEVDYDEGFELVEKIVEKNKDFFIKYYRMKVMIMSPTQS
ncbi:MAG: hypothetical protein ABEK36_03980 [Candidatus Aenigmatarchaeota archaeon]